MELGTNKREGGEANDNLRPPRSMSSAVECHFATEFNKGLFSRKEQQISNQLYLLIPMKSMVCTFLLK